MNGITKRGKVKHAAKLLDQRGPENWRQLVDPERLDLFSGRDCVLGQVFADEGGYSRGLRVLEIEMFGLNRQDVDLRVFVSNSFRHAWLRELKREV